MDIFKAMAYISTSYNILDKDMELEQIKQELTELKETLKNRK